MDYEPNVSTTNLAEPICTLIHAETFRSFNAELAYGEKRHILLPCTSPPEVAWLVPSGLAAPWARVDADSDTPLRA